MIYIIHLPDKMPGSAYGWAIYNIVVYEEISQSRFQLPWPLSVSSLFRYNFRSEGCFRYKIQTFHPAVDYRTTADKTYDNYRLLRSSKLQQPRWYAIKRWKLGFIPRCLSRSIFDLFSTIINCVYRLRAG